MWLPQLNEWQPGSPRKQVEAAVSVGPAPRSGHFLLPGSQDKVYRSCGHLGQGQGGRLDHRAGAAGGPGRPAGSQAPVRCSLSSNTGQVAQSCQGRISVHISLLLPQSCEGRCHPRNRQPRREGRVSVKRIHSFHRWPETSSFGAVHLEPEASQMGWSRVRRPGVGWMPAGGGVVYFPNAFCQFCHPPP